LRWQSPESALRWAWTAFNLGDARILTTSTQAPARGPVRSGGARKAVLASTAILALILPQVARASDDPWEPANRTFYMVHRVLDDNVFSKIAAIFKAIPAPIRTVVRNVIANLGEPGVAANDLLQGHPEVTARTLGRFATNTTVGIGGMIDVAAKVGLPHHNNDFADTFGRWGAPPGPYLFITMIGPTTVRDEAGAIADTLTDPFTWSRFYHRWTAIDARTIWGGLDEQAEADAQLRAIDNMSTDSYATLRSLYLQNRAAVIAAPPGAEPGAGPGPALPDFGDAPGAGAAPAPGATPPADSVTPPPEPPKPAAGLEPVRPPTDPSSDVLAANRRDGRLLAALSFAAEPNL
jgi:phospholipid-binding lipoprotein MlaA